MIVFNNWLRRLFYIVQVVMHARHREHDLEGGARSGARTFSHHRAAVQFNQLAHDGEPESKPAVPSSARRVELTEAIKDVEEKLRIDALSRITDGDFNLGIAALQPHFNAPAFRCELDRVRQKIPDNLLEPFGVAGDRTYSRINCSLEMNVSGIGCGLHAFNDRFDYPVHFQHAYVEAKLSRDDARDVK